jgi:hypothetical protein
LREEEHSEAKLAYGSAKEGNLVHKDEFTAHKKEIILPIFRAVNGCFWKKLPISSNCLWHTGWHRY